MTPDEFKAAHAILRDRGYTDKDIARMLGISPARASQTFYEWRSERKKISPPTALLLEGYAYREWAHWQPIETAPKYGAFVIVRLGNNEVFAAQHVNGAWIAASGVGRVNPTHWMPLPEPPAPPKESEQ